MSLKGNLEISFPKGKAMIIEGRGRLKDDLNDAVETKMS
jgi:hypothetical protein